MIVRETMSSTYAEVAKTETIMWCGCSTLHVETDVGSEKEKHMVMSERKALEEAITKLNESIDMLNRIDKAYRRKTGEVNQPTVYKFLSKRLTEVLCSKRGHVCLVAQLTRISG